MSSVVGGRVREPGEIAGRGDSLIVVEDVNASGRRIDRDCREPLRAIVARTAVEQQRRGKGEPLVAAPLKRDVCAVLIVVDRVHYVDVAAESAVRFVDGHRWKIVHPVVSEHLIHREEVGRQVHGSAPRGAVVGRSRETDVVRQTTGAAGPGDVSVRGSEAREARDRSLTIDGCGGHDLSRRPGRGCRGRDVIRECRRDLDTPRGRWREVGPAHDDAPGVRIDVHELLVGVV